MPVQLPGHDRLDAPRGTSPARVQLRARDRADVVQRKPVSLKAFQLAAPGQVVLVADAVEQHDLPFLATVAQRVEHAHEGRESRSRRHEERGVVVVLQQEAALGALDVDRVPHPELPEEVGERPAFHQADEELVLGQVVGGG